MPLMRTSGDCSKAQKLMLVHVRIEQQINWKLTTLIVVNLVWSVIRCYPGFRPFLGLWLSGADYSMFAGSCLQLSCLFLEQQVGCSAVFVLVWIFIHHVEYRGFFGRRQQRSHNVSPTGLGPSCERKGH